MNRRPRPFRLYRLRPESRFCRRSPRLEKVRGPEDSASRSTLRKEGVELTLRQRTERGQGRTERSLSGKLR
eukprot:scaffold72034_cov51-Phaeocystis_antarctica.AAC.1